MEANTAPKYDPAREIAIRATLPAPLHNADHAVAEAMRADSDAVNERARTTAADSAALTQLMGAGWAAAQWALAFLGRTS